VILATRPISAVLAKNSGFAKSLLTILLDLPVQTNNKTKQGMLPPASLLKTETILDEPLAMLLLLQASGVSLPLLFSSRAS